MVAPNQFIRLNGIRDVSIQGGDYKVDVDRLEILPTRVEESIKSFINCRSVEERYNKTTKIRTRRTVSVEMSQTVSTSSETKVGFSIGGGSSFGRLNGDLVQRNTFSVTRKEAQTVEEEYSEEIPEDRKIPPKTELFIKALVTKGFAKAPVLGTVTIDAVVNIDHYAFNGAIIVRGAEYALSHPIFLNEPARRTATINGLLFAESYVRTDMLYADRAVQDGDPRCAFSRKMPSLVPHPRLVIVDAYAGAKDRSVPDFKRARETITITLENTDVGDLFVWLWDCNTSGEDLLIDGDRLNRGERRDVAVQADGEGRGLLTWRAVRTDDPEREKQRDRIEVEDSETVEVTTFL
jgi:hypothetical protein